MLNRIMMMGRLTADPELRNTQNGTELATFGVAVQRPKSKDGEAETDFFNCIAWKNRAKIVSEYYHKGDMILIEGTLRNRRWTDEEGKNHKIDQIVVTNIHFTGGQKKNEISDVPAELNDFNTLSESDLEGFEELLNDDGVPF